MLWHKHLWGGAEMSIYFMMLLVVCSSQPFAFHSYFVKFISWCHGIAIITLVETVVDATAKMRNAKKPDVTRIDEDAAYINTVPRNLISPEDVQTH